MHDFTCCSQEYKAAGGVEGAPDFERPVMVHRAMLGSVERMAAVLTEHWGGKWPFWLSPRQAIIVPVDLKFLEFAESVQTRLHAAGFYVDVDGEYYGYYDIVVHVTSCLCTDIAFSFI